MSTEKVRIGFLPCHRDPFNEAWAIKMRERCLKEMAKIKEIEVVVPKPGQTYKGLVRDDADAAKVMDLFFDAAVEGLVIGTMTFGDEISACTVAQGLGVPILLFGTKEGPFTEDGNRLSDAFCGTLSISSGLHRRRLPFTFLDILFPEEEIFKTGLKDFAKTCAGVAGFLGAKVGMVGPRPERFETCAFNEAPLIEQFEQRVVQLSTADLFAKANAYSDSHADIRRILGEIKSCGCKIKMDKSALLKSAKIEKALMDWALEKELNCMAVQCWSAMQDIMGIASCLAFGRLTQQGMMTACEVDVIGALTMLLQYEASLHVTVPHFIDWTIQHQEKENVFYAWHCGNAPPCLAAPGQPAVIGTHSILDRVASPDRCQGVSEFQLAPGPVTLNRLVEEDGDFRLLITNGTIIEDNATRRGSWSWVEVPDLKYLYRVLVEEGFLHHASMIHGDISEPLVQLCEYLDIEPVMV